MKKIINKLKFYFRKKFPNIKKTDYLLVSFPKTGSTFTRLVFANIKAIINKTPKEVDFYNLLEIMPELGTSSLLEKIDQSKIPRIIKTHDIYQNIFNKTNNYIYIVRDPRDTLISYYHYACHNNSILYKGDLKSFIKNKEYGLESLNKHIESWKDKKKTIFKYEDLMEKPLIIFKNFFKDNKIKILDSVILKAVDLSKPNRMKKIESEKRAPDIDKNFKKGFKFIRNAKLNQWKDILDNDSLNYIKNNASNEFINLGYKL